MKTGRSILTIVLIALVGFGVSLAADAAKGGNKPAVEVTNNLSMPALHTSDAASAATWNVPPGVLGETYSYGCDKEEVVQTSTATFTYPNTSCVDALGTYLTAAQCQAVGGPCEGLAVGRIYWQKVSTNDWWAQSRGPMAPATAAYLDWGDNLESVSWSDRSVVRVETTPYGSMIPWAVPFDPLTQTCEQAALSYGLDPLAVCQLGFQMWHVLGQGPSEQWGVRATDEALPLPWVYETPFGVIHSYAARLHMAKLTPDPVVCPGNVGSSPPPTGFSWDTSFTPPRWVTGTGADACTLRDIPYTAELNVGGRYVYGYNWMLRRDEMPSECGPGWSKAGWWRLTFYTGNGDVLFDPLNPVVEPLAPPPGLPAQPTVMFVPLVPTLAPEGEEGALYTPVIDYSDNLTYIDVCIVAGGRGGGGGNGGGNGGGGGRRN